MPLSAHEQRVIAAIEDELNRQEPQLCELFTRCPPPGSPGPPVVTQQERRRLGARWAALPLAVATWVFVVALVVVVSGVGLADAALIVTALVMLVGVHLARFLARRALYRRFGSDAHPGGPHRED